MNLLKVAFMAKILQKTFCYKTLNFTTDDSKKKIKDLNAYVTFIN